MKYIALGRSGVIPDMSGVYRIGERYILENYKSPMHNHVKNCNIELIEIYIRGQISSFEKNPTFFISTRLN